MNNVYTKWLFLVGFAVLVLFLLSSAVFNFKQASLLSSSNSIPVSGMGEVVSKPDVATFSFTISEKAAKGVNAQEALNKKAEPTVKALKDAGISEDDIQTTNYSLNPVYEYPQNKMCVGSYCPPGNPVITGFEASETFTIKVRNLEKAADMLQIAGSNGVQNIRGLQMTVDDPSKLKSEARGKAIADARKQAEEIAKAAHLRLGKIISINEDGGAYPVPFYGDMAVKSEAVGNAPRATIEAGTQKITSNVTVIFELK